MSRRSTIYGFTAVMLITVIALMAPSGPMTKTSRAAFQQMVAATVAATATATEAPTADSAHPLLNPCTGQPFTTVMTGAGMASASAGVGNAGTDYVVNFTLASNSDAVNFGTFTASHIRQPMAIVLDGQVVSAPVIEAALTTGGQITGRFTQDQAKTLASQLSSGALPISLHVEAVAQAGTGSQVLLTADPTSAVDSGKMDEARQIIERRLTALGVVGFVIKVPANNQIEVDLPTANNQQAVIDTISKQGLLEFVDFSQPAGCTASMPSAGQYILTDKQISLATAVPTTAATSAE